MTKRSRAAAVVYRWLLNCYPRDFRDRNGLEMERLFGELEDDARRTSGVGGVWLYRLGAWWDVIRNGTGLRVDRARERRRRAGTPMGHTSRDGEGGVGMETFVRDVRHAVRALRKSPGFTAVAVLTIALGIGANTAIFSVVRAVLMAPLPYDEPGELVVLWGEMQNRGVTTFPMSPPDFARFRDEVDGFESLGAVFSFTTPLTGDGDPVQVTVGNTTTDFFSMLGIEPILGRTFLPEDGLPQPNTGQAGTGPGPLPGIALLGHGLWQTRFGGDPSVIGRTIQLGGATSEVVGVMPPDFELLMPPAAAVADDVDLWLAARIDFVNAPANNVFLRPVGRMKPGVSVEALQAQIDVVAADLAANSQVKATAGYAVRAASLHRDLTGHVRPIILALFGAVVFVLLIACANVSNLLLVRASSRDRELAVRAALGGSRGRLLRQMLLESGLLAAAGAALGMAIAALGIRALLWMTPADLPRVDAVGIDGVVLLFTVAAAGTAALVFGLVPALQASRVDLADALKERGSAGSNSSRRLVRNAVVIVEVALSLVLLIGAGLMVRSFVELSNVRPGYEADGLLTFNANPPFGTYPGAADRSNFNMDVRRSLEAIPGVEQVALAGPLPLTGQPLNGRYGGEEALTDPEAFGQAAYRAVTPGYFETMGTALLAGRAFTDADYNDSTAVVVVDEVLAGVMWPDRSAIGERFLVRLLAPEPVWVEVVGVVEHQRAESLAEVGRETVYFTDKYFGSFGGTWAVRSDMDAGMLLPRVREAIGGIDASVPIADVELMTTYVDEAMAPTRFALTLIGLFGIVALLLTSVGLYGVLSYVVRQRTAEIGVRMAFGAEAGSILRMVVMHGLGLAGLGAALGVLAAVPLTRFIESLLIGVTPTDPVTFGGITLLFAIVAFAACYIPASRATGVDPVRALREE